MNSSTPFNWPFRLKASLIHLGASGLLAVITAIIVFALWYPEAYRNMSGGTELFMLVVGVDVTIGPLITLTIFDRRKSLKELRRDMAVVVALQLAACGYGLYTVSVSRPVVLALEGNRFRVVAATDVYIQELASAAPGLRRLSLTGPHLVRSIVPTDPTKKSDSLFLALKGFDVGTRPSLWAPWDGAARSEALSHAKPLSTLSHQVDQSAIDAAVAKTGRQKNKLAYIPMITFRNKWVALLDTTDGDVVGFAPFDGF